MHLNWIAVDAAGADLMLDALGLQEVGASFDPREAEFACARTAKGWRVVVGASMKLRLEGLLPKLARQGEVLAGEASDIVMFSRLQGWRDGARLWSVSHDPEAGADDLEIEGGAPAALSGIAARLRARQLDEAEPVDHLFDAPLELGEDICGFRPDAPPAVPWILLSSSSRPKGSPVSSLPAAIRLELLPALADLGWTVGPVECPANGRAYDARRIRNGRLEFVALLWRDDRRDLEIVPSFALLESDAPDGRVVVSGSIHRERPSLVQKIKAWRPGQAGATYDEKVRQAVAVGLSDLPTIGAAIDDSSAAVAG